MIFNTQIAGGSSIITGGITQDSNGFLVLDPNGSSGGGSGDTWSWMGKNPVKVATLPAEHSTFADLGVDEWTYSTSLTSFRATQDYETTTAANIANYDYIQLVTIRIHYDYGNWTPVSTPLDFIAFSSIYAFRNYIDYASMQSGTLSYTNTSMSSPVYQLIYANSSGTPTMVKTGYGLYSTSGVAPSVANPNTTTPTITWKKPIIYIRGSNAYFSETAYNNLDFDESYYEISSEVWRMDAGTNDISYAEQQLPGLLGT